MMEDPFATGDDLAGAAMLAKRNQIITAGRYRLPDLDGSAKKGGWQRVTNLVKAISDQFSLRVWEIEQILVALHVNESAVMKMLRVTLVQVQGQPYAARRSGIEEFIEFCKSLSGGNEGSKFGNARHELVEADHLAIPTAAPDAYARQHLHLFKSALVRNDLVRVPDLAERRVVIPEFDAIGTLDAVLEDLRSRSLHIGDLKTQKKFWTWLEIAAQLACYARAVAMWVPTDPQNARVGRWVDMPKVSIETAFVLWMPKEHPSGEPAVDVYEVDIEAGWRTAQLAREVVLDRRGGKSATVPRARLREAPSVTETERYAARFAAVSSLAEGSALVAEAKAKRVWNIVLAEEARTAKERLEKVR
jgi:hypothetical protein